MNISNVSIFIKRNLLICEPDAENVERHKHYLYHSIAYAMLLELIPAVTMYVYNRPILSRPYLLVQIVLVKEEYYP